MDRRGKRILSTATQDHTLKNHWVSKKKKTNKKLAPYLPRFLLFTSRRASENTHVVSLLGGLRFTCLPLTSVTIEVSRAQPLASAFVQNSLPESTTHSQMWGKKVNWNSMLCSLEPPSYCSKLYKEVNTVKWLKRLWQSNESCAQMQCTAPA